MRASRRQQAAREAAELVEAAARSKTRNARPADNDGEYADDEPAVQGKGKGKEKAAEKQQKRKASGSKESRPKKKTKKSVKMARFHRMFLTSYFIIDR